MWHITHAYHLTNIICNIIWHKMWFASIFGDITLLNNRPLGLVYFEMRPVFSFYLPPGLHPIKSQELILVCWWLQVWSQGPTGGLCGVSDAFPAHRGGEQAAASVREGTAASGAAGRGRPLHAPLQQDRAPHTEDEHHHFRGELHWQH